MELSIFLAKFLSLYMLILAAIWIMRKRWFEAEIREIILSKGTFPLTGAIHIIAGLIIVIAHPILKANWQGLITLIGCLTILQGILRLAFPEESREVLLKSFQKCSWLWIIFLLIFGGTFFYFGFIT